MKTPLLFLKRHYEEENQMFRTLLSSVVALSIGWSTHASALDLGTDAVETVGDPVGDVVVGGATALPSLAGTQAVISKPAAPRNLVKVDGPLPALKVLAFVDEQTQDRHGVLLGEWAAEVAKEGTFQVEWIRRPRVASWNSTNRLSSVQSMLNTIQTRNPAAVMFWGAVGWAATGTFNPDGHVSRVSWTDVPFASDHKVWTDTQDFQVTHSSATALNLPGDGKWDQVFDIVAAVRAKRSVGRVDFSNLASSNPSVNVDEHAAMDDYLRRNLAYRRGQGFSNEVVFVGSILSPATKEWLATSITGRTVTDLGAVQTGVTYPAAGKRLFAMYTSVVPYLRDGFKDASGTMTSTLWLVLYKSWGADPWIVQETERQYLRQSLVVTWGGRHWVPNGETVHEAYLKYSYPGLGCLTAQDTLMGDVTLRLK